MDETTENQQPEVSCREVLYRVVLRKRHIAPDGQVTADLFMLRPDDEGGLSVFRQELVSLTRVESHFNKTWGTFTLHTGRVRDTATVLNRSVEVKSEEIPEVSGHAVIVGLPDPVKEFEFAEFAASLLRDQCRPADRNRDLGS